jgi:large subunit ribosomal protein L3
MLGLIGKKIGMTQLFTEDGAIVPVTAIEAGPCPIVLVRTDERDGYRAVQLGFGRKKEKRSTKPSLGHAAGAGLDYAPAITREFRLGPDDALAEDPHTPATAVATEPAAELAAEAEEAAPQGDEAAAAEDVGATEDAGAAEEASLTAEAAGVPEELRVGQLLTVGIFGEGERVKVTGTTIGRGFQGVIKRHGFRGFPKSHGHPVRRQPGSIGPGTDPSRVIKGRKMAGQMGSKRKTVRNLTVVRIDAERNLIFVKGPVPGSRNSWVFVGKQ